VRRGPIAVVAAALLAACVPETEEVDPRGGVGIVTEPSPATRGESFVTADGWTVRIELFVLQAFLFAYNADGGEATSAAFHLFRASDPQHFILRALSVGRTSAGLNPMTQSVGPYFFDGSQKGDGALDAAIVARFNRIADDIPPGLALEAGSTEFELSETGPAMLLIAQGEKEGRVVRLDLALGETGASSSSGPGANATDAVSVVANALVDMRVRISAEAFFNEEGTLVFEDIVKADADQDGNISPRELRRFRIPECEGCTEEEKALNEADASTTALTSIFARRMGALLVRQ
jgi:hypothetical protein